MFLNSFTLSYLSIIITGVISYIVWRRFYRRNGRLPPGPIGWPGFGCAPLLGPRPQLTITKWGEKYGSVFSYYLGPRQLIVVLNDLAAIRQCFVDQGEFFVDRANNFFLDLRSGGASGLSQANGELWREQRKFVMRAFAGLGVGKSHFEQLCLVEVDRLIADFSQYACTQTPCSSRSALLLSFSNVMGALCFGKRFEPNNACLNRYVNNIKGVSDMLGNSGLLQGIPLLRFLPPWRNKWLYYEREVANELELIKVACNEVKKNLQINNNNMVGRRRSLELHHRGTCHSDQNGNVLQDNEHANENHKSPQCVVEQFYERRASLEAAGKQKLARTNYTDHQLHMLIVDLFGAAIETSANAINWAILLLALNPPVQHTAFQQIAERVGVDRPITWNDRRQLPYIEAVVLETLRRGNQVPIGLARQPSRDIFLNGYVIPRDAMVVPNLWNIHANEINFTNPEKFQPERMLDEVTGDVKTSKNSNVVPPVMSFGLGKRACVGEDLAKKDIFLYLANLLQKFEFCACMQTDGRPFPGVDDYTTSINTSPIPYEVLLKFRQ